MKKILRNGVCLLVAAMLSSATAWSADVTKPTFTTFAYSDASMAEKISDNGQWLLLYPAYGDDAASAQAKLLNIETGTEIELESESTVTTYGASTFLDITDDGTLIVGATYDGQPAYYLVSDEEWVLLPMPDGCSGGTVNSVTPDGHYAVGTCTGSGYEGVLWDLTGDSIIELPNKPTLDMTHTDLGIQTFECISADGRYIISRVSYYYLLPVSLCTYIYDTQEQTYKFLGFDDDDEEDWTPWVEGLYYVSEAYICPSGEWVTCLCYVVNDDSEFSCSARYNTQTGEFELFDDVDDQDMVAYAIDDTGTLYAATPSTSPIRDLSVRYEQYWIGLDQILEQGYGVDFENQTAYDNTGTLMSVSADGRSLVVMVDPSTGDSYLLQLPEDILNACDGIDLLGEYTVTPASGTTFTKLKEIDILFERDIEILGSSSDIVLYDSQGEQVRTAIGLSVSTSSSTTAVITFRSTTLDADSTYTVVIPEGTLCISGDTERTNSEIILTYTGRADEAIQPTYYYPQDGSLLAKLDNSTNYLTIGWNAYVALTDTAAATLVRVTDGVTITDLNVYVEDNLMACYPSSTQYLYNGNDYQIILNAGSVTDLSGCGANEEVVVTYGGTYERTLSSDDIYLFEEDFSDVSNAYLNFMRWEGDHQEPDDEMAALNFDADNYPWYFMISDDDSTNYCAASHSQYATAGTSDDWMVIPQMVIPNEYVTLKFDAQSYRTAKSDSLWVYVWQHDTGFSDITDSIAALMKEGAELVFCERLYPGDEEEVLYGDWVNYEISLAAYSGQAVYICFANLNTDQSAVFVDNVVVERELKYLLTLGTASSVVNLESIPITGTLTANSEDDTFTSITLTLLDADGNQVDQISESGLELSYGTTYPFEFTTELPLTVGEENEFSISVQLDDFTDAVEGSVKDLTFQPTKRVVLEEMTGTTCVNCPLGILGIENCEKAFGENFIPISIHTYTGDSYGSGLSSYTDYLGLSAAPSGVIDRTGTIYYPMAQDAETGDYVFSNGELWYDIVLEQLETPADMDIEAVIDVDQEEETFDLEVTVTYALNAVNLNLNVFVVVMEDSCISYQQNTYASVADDNLGEWGKGGIYASSVVYNYPHMHVVRNAYGSSWAGSSGFFSQSMTAGIGETVDLTGMTIPGTLSDINNAKAAVLLIDANTDEVLNAVVVKFTSATGINDVLEEAITTVTSGLRQGVYTLTGVRVCEDNDTTGLPAGIYIVGGKKVLVK